MKCEICHKRDAKTALVKEDGDEDNELYVCAECAKAERLKRQKKSQRTRKIVEINGEIVEGDDVPPIIGAIMGAFDNVFGEIEKEVKKSATSGKKAEKAKKNEIEKPEFVKDEYRDFPLSRVVSEFRIGARLHLEGLHLIGELDAVHRSMRALGIELIGVNVDGVSDTGHVYALRYTGSTERVKRILGDLLREENNARVRLREEMPRLFGDALCRALAILKNCRLLHPGELFDLLSPLRLAAAKKNLLDGISLAEIEKSMSKIDLSDCDDSLDFEERQMKDAKLADKINKRFEEVMLTEDAEGRFL